MSASKTCGDTLLDDCLREAIECALEVRDEVGANVAKTFILTRTWTGSDIGVGHPVDTKERLRPSPSISEIKKDFQLRNVGMVRSGDVMLKSIPISIFPTENEARLVTSDKYVEKFFYIDGALYRPISVNKKFATWDIIIRPVIQDQTYTDQTSSDIIA